MAVFRETCRRCGTNKTSFEIAATNPSFWTIETYRSRHTRAEVFCVCSSCSAGSIAIFEKLGEVVTTGNTKVDETNKDLFRQVWHGERHFEQLSGPVNTFARFVTFVRIDSVEKKPLPELIPEPIKNVVLEGTVCLSLQCWNAAGAMFRLALDLATKDLLPEQGEPTQRVRRSLGLRLDWMFDTGLLPSDLRGLAECLQQDGNDGAHDGSLSAEDAEDLYDFSFELLKRLYTEPERIRLATERRNIRRTAKSDTSRSS